MPKNTSITNTIKNSKQRQVLLHNIFLLYHMIKILATFSGKIILNSLSEFTSYNCFLHTLKMEGQDNKLQTDNQGKVE